MRSLTTRFLRNMAATLMCAAGAVMVAALWLRELNQLAVLDALVGAVYLIAGIGLFGYSRFSVFLGVVIPLGVSGTYFVHSAEVLAMDQLRYATDGVIAAFSAIVLWMVRNQETR